MNLSAISTTWALLEKTAKILILTESDRLPLAEKIRIDNLIYVAEVKIIDIGINNTYEQEMMTLTEEDLLIILLTTDGFMSKGYRDKFSPFSKPPGFAGKYIFIRLDIPEGSLLSGLNTDIGKVESIIHDRQQEYYAAINASNGAGESTVFIEFMLSAIKASLIDAINTNDEMSDGKIDKVTLRWHKIQEYLKTHDYIMNADVRELCGVSAATANRILASFVAEGNLIKYHEGGHWAYRNHDK